jgi:hypothetical protein
MSLVSTKGQGFVKSSKKLLEILYLLCQTGDATAQMISALNQVLFYRMRQTNQHMEALKMLNFICEQEAGHINTGSTKVSAVFRAVSPSENQYNAAKRSGVNNMSLATKGIGKSSSGQLCMVGCLGLVNAKWSICNI